jgi:hypothetical protein
VLSDAEKMRIRHHFGMPLLSMNPTISAGVPLPTPLLTRLELAMTLVLQDAEPIIRSTLQKCDDSEQAVFEAQDRLVAEKVDGITLRADELSAREVAYMRWVGRLEDHLGVCINPFSERATFKPSHQGTNVGNIRVSR